MDSKKNILAMLSILAAGSLWGTLGVFVRVYNKYQLESMDIVVVRGIGTTIIMFIFLILYKKELFRIRFKDLWCFLGTGIGSIVLFNYCYFKTITLTSMSVAAILLYTAPSIVMIFSAILFDEKLTRTKIFSLICTFLGCVLVTDIAGDAKSLTVTGVITGLGAGFGYALYSIFSRYALEKGYQTFTISFYTFFIVTLSTLPFVNQTKIIRTVTENYSMFGLFLVFGSVSTVLPYILYTFGLKNTENGKAAILASIEPIVATLLGFFLYGEKIDLSGFVGICLVIMAITMCNVVKPKEI